jgi:hypothetical protein
VPGLKSLLLSQRLFWGHQLRGAKSKELGPTALKQLLIFIRLWRILRATSAGVYFPKYSNVVRKILSIHPATQHWIHRCIFEMGSSLADGLQSLIPYEDDRKNKN